MSEKQDIENKNNRFDWEYRDCGVRFSESQFELTESLF